LKPGGPFASPEFRNLNGKMELPIDCRRMCRWMSLEELLAFVTKSRQAFVSFGKALT
jgi:hypothetical protein